MDINGVRKGEFAEQYANQIIKENLSFSHLISKAEYYVRGELWPREDAVPPLVSAS